MKEDSFFKFFGLETDIVYTWFDACGQGSGHDEDSNRDRVWAVAMCVLPAPPCPVAIPASEGRDSLVCWGSMY